VGPETRQADPMAVLGALQDARLIRSDTRGDSTWWELSHDTMVTAVLDDNRRWWLLGRLLPWQLAARDWAEDRDRDRLLTGLRLREAQRTADSLNLTDDERKFLEESVGAEKGRSKLAHMKSAVASLGFVVVVEAAVIVVLLVLLFLS